MEIKYRRLLKDTAIFAIGNLGSKLILFLLVPLYTNCMTASEYGTADLIFTVAELLMPFLSVVIFDAVIRFGLMKHQCPENVLRVGINVWIAGSAVCAAITPFIGCYSLLREWKWYICMYIVFNMAYSIMMNYLKVMDRNKLYAALSIMQTFLLAVVNVVLLAGFHMGIRGYLISYITANLVSVVVLLTAGGIGKAYLRGVFDRQLAKQMLIYSSPLILNNISWWVIHSSDKIMIEWMVNAAALGVFSVAAKIPALINVIISFFSQAWGIASTREMESGNDTTFYAQVFHAYQLVTCAVCIGFVSIVKVFMQIYVGEAFQDAWKYVPLLLASAVFSSAASYYGSMYKALKQSVNNMYTTLLAAGTNIVVNYICILRIGVWGAVIGTVVSYFLLAVVRAADISRSVKMNIAWGRIAGNWSIMMIQAIAVSMDFHVYAVSAAAAALFAGINYRDVVRLAANRGGTK